MCDEAMRLPSASSELSGWRLPLVASQRAVRATMRTREALVAEAIAARRTLDHVRFVSALTALASGRAVQSVEAVARLASEAYGTEATGLVATIAGRWVHAESCRSCACQPPTSRKRRTPGAVGARRAGTSGGQR